MFIGKDNLAFDHNVDARDKKDIGVHDRSNRNSGDASEKDA